MKKVIIPVLIIIILVMGTYIVIDKYQLSKNDTQNVVQKNNQEIADTKKKPVDLFAKKKECANYEDKIMKNILDPNLIYDDLDPILEEIFYSPKRNSCLYVFRYLFSDICNKDNLNYEMEIKCLQKEKQIVDFFTKETVYSSNTYNNCFERLIDKEGADISVCKTVSEKADELKN